MRTNPRFTYREGHYHLTDDRPLLDTLADMTAASIARAYSAARELMLVRVAGLIAVDNAPPASDLLNSAPQSTAG